MQIQRRISIIFMACHGLALSDLSCYGQTNFQTPNLDRLATEGMRFTDYRVGGDDLEPAQAALMAGNQAAFPPSQPTVAWRLQQAGYHTGLVGEWTLGAQPWTQGFDDFAGFFSEQEADNYYSDFVRRYAPKGILNPSNHTFEALSLQEEIYPNTGGRKGEFIPDLLVKAMVNFVRTHVPDPANHFQPFFLLVTLPAPHSVTPGRDDYPVPTDAPYSGEKWPQAAKNRAALVTRLDNGVGRLLEQLNKLQMTNNVAIFLSGAVAPEKFADRNLDFLKLKGEVRGGVSDERLRVPMIVRWPGFVPAGRVSDVPWTAADFAPTALAIARLKPVASYTGVSRLPLLLDQPATHQPAPAVGTNQP
jgi:arylsulfatase A-like enzyme